jgi:hypothetical protein
MIANEKAAAIIVAVGLLATAIGFGGIYETPAAPENAAFLWRVNRFTGAVAICSAQNPAGPSANTNIVDPVCWDAPWQKSPPTR